MFKFVTGEKIMAFILSRIPQPAWPTHAPQGTICLPWRGSVPSSGSCLHWSSYCQLWLVLSGFGSQLILTLPLILTIPSYCLKLKSMTRYYIAFLLFPLLTTCSALSFILQNPCSMALKLLYLNPITFQTKPPTPCPCTPFEKAYPFLYPTNTWVSATSQVCPRC